MDIIFCWGSGTRLEAVIQESDGSDTADLGCRNVYPRVATNAPELIHLCNSSVWEQALQFLTGTYRLDQPGHRTMEKLRGHFEG